MGGLNASNGFDVVKTSVSQLEGALSGLDVLVAQPPPLDAALDSKYHDLAARADYWKRAVEDWEKTETALQQASGLDGYFRTLGRWAQSPFATDAQRDAVAEIERLNINEPTLLGELLLPNAREVWDSLTKYGVVAARVHAGTTDGGGKDGLPEFARRQKYAGCLRVSIDDEFAAGKSVSIARGFRAGVDHSRPRGAGGRAYLRSH